MLEHCKCTFGVLQTHEAWEHCVHDMKIKESIIDEQQVLKTKNMLDHIAGRQITLKATAAAFIQAK